MQLVRGIIAITGRRGARRASPPRPTPPMFSQIHRSGAAFPTAGKNAAGVRARNCARNTRPQNPPANAAPVVTAQAARRVGVQV